VKGGIDRRVGISKGWSYYWFIVFFAGKKRKGHTIMRRVVTRRKKKTNPKEIGRQKTHISEIRKKGE